MAELCYPVFEEGQTLTRDDLNGLREFFDERVREVGRAVGFGISCGLDGQIDSAGPALELDAGVGIDHVGEVLVLEDGVRIALPPAVNTAVEFDFLTGNTGFTPVLVKLETEEPAPDCDEVGCEGHAATTCREAQVVVVPGRLDDPRFDFASEPLITGSAPLAANPTAAQFAALRSAITTRLHNHISAQAEAKLAAQAIAANDLVAVRNHKAAFLNQVLFAALDLLRCEALMNIACERTAAQPGIALGWVHQVGGTWTWDCNWRHAWEPPPGLSIALVGGACDDACRLHRQRIESLIDTFELPVVPAPGDGPKPGGDDPGPYTPCPKKKYTGPYYHEILIWEDCGFVFDPPLLIDPDWFEPWVVVDPKYPPDVGPMDPWEIYGNPEPDWLGEGLIDLTETYGRDPDVVTPALIDAMEGAGVSQPNVQIMSAADAGGLAGFLPAAAVSPADTVVLVVDNHGKVTTTGHVPSQIGVRDAAAGVGAATAAANEALSTAQGLEATVGGHASLLDTHGEQLEAFGLEIDGLVQFRKEADPVLDGLDNRVSQEANQVLAQYQATIGPLLDNAILDAVGKVEERFAKDIEQQTENIVAPFKEQMSDFQARVETTTINADKAQARIDEVLVRSVGIRSRTVADADVVGFLQVMRGAIEAGAAGRERAQVAAELAKGDEQLKRLDASVAGEALPETEAREAVTGVLDAFVSALGASGAPADQVKELKARAEDLRGRR